MSTKKRLSVPSGCLFTLNRRTSNVARKRINKSIIAPLFVSLFLILVGCATSVENTTDQALLGKIALQDKDLYVRRAAVEKLTDQALLGKIALQDKDLYVRLAAVKKLTDQALLGKIALQDKDKDVRVVAVEELNDQALLAKIAVEDTEQYVRKSAVKKLNDQVLLARIAWQDKHKDVRIAAVEKLNDQALLAKIAIEGKHKDVRIAAVEELNDQALLVEIEVKRPGLVAELRKNLRKLEYPNTATGRFCKAWDQLKPGMTIEQIGAAGINTWLPCTPGTSNTNNLGHIIFKFDSSCRLKFAQTAVPCKKRIIKWQ